MLATDGRKSTVVGHKSPTPAGGNRIAALVGFRPRGDDPSTGYVGGVLVRGSAGVGERRLRYLVAEARCYWCGTVAGTLEGGWPLMPGTLMFRRSGEHQALAPVRPASPAFRCGHCGGPLFVDDFDIMIMRSEKLEEVEDRPRRGRPPKRPR